MSDPAHKDVQDAVAVLASLGPMPAAEQASDHIIGKWESALLSLKTPISSNDAKVLVGLFGTDDCFGLAWTMIHALETAPEWPIWDLLPASGGDWIQLLRHRAGA